MASSEFASPTAAEPASVADTAVIDDAETAVIVEESAAEAAPAVPAPRTRWAGIVWGLMFVALAAAGAAVAAVPARFTTFLEWAVQTTPEAATAYALLTIGAVLLISGIVGLLRRAQLALARRR